jgi:hypothetical protein
MRKALLALILAGVAPVAMSTASSPSDAGAALTLPRTVEAPSAVTRVDYYRRHYNRAYRHHHRRPAAYGYYAPRAYYPARGYYSPPPVVYYPPPVVVYYPPPIVYGAYPPPVAPYRYVAPTAVYYDRYSDW